MGEHRHNAKVLGVATLLLVVVVAAETALEFGIVEGLSVLLGGLLVFVGLAYAGVFVAGWVGYAAGFHERERLSGWRFHLAFLMMPIGAFAVPIVSFLSLRPLLPIVPKPMAEAMKEEMAASREST